MVASKERKNLMSFKYVNVLFLVMICILCFSKEVFAEDIEDDYYKTVTYSKNISSGFLYSDDMMLVNANELSTDIAKIAMGLANAAYEENEIKNCLFNMGYALFGGNTYNYSRDATYSDNDFVAYTVGYRKIQNYNVYIVAVRGTTGNCEWLSNFKLGKTDYHEGFKKAADEILSTLYNEVTTTNNIFLVTGHSRGAAVANIVAGELSLGEILATTDHIFGYTYACPAVKFDLRDNHSNIYNFNNPGDAITMMPLPEWKYYRYGKDIDLSSDKDIFGNFKQRFETVEKSEYAGMFNADAFAATLKTIARTREDYYKEPNPLLFDFFGWILGPKDLKTLTQLIAANQLKTGQTISNTTQNALKKIMWNILIGECEYDLNEDFRDEYALLQNIDDALSETVNMTSEEFTKWNSSQSLLQNEIYNALDIIVEAREDLITARNKLDGSLSEISYIYPNIEALFLLVNSTDGKIKDSIWHAHQPSTYVLWMNSMYYGYEGWKDNTSISEVNLNATIQTIGKQCFYGCTNLSNIRGIDNVEGFANEACYGLSNLEFIGSFAKDIKSVGQYAFAECTNVKGEIHQISEYVGTSAFSGCRGITGKLVLSGNIKTIPYSAFYNTGLEEIEIKENVTSVKYGAFKDCVNLRKAVISDTVSELEGEAFRGCEGLQEITLPVSATYISSDLPYDTFVGVRVNKITFTQGTGVTFIPYKDSCSITQNSKGTLTTVKFCEGIEEIYESILKDCNNVTSIELPESIKRIGNCAFYNCGSWKGKLHLPENLESLGSEAFWGCSSLSGDVKIPSNLKNISEAVFSGCSSLNGNIIFNNIVETIDSNAFNGCNGITGRLELPESLLEIGSFAFSGCSGITGKLLLSGKIKVISDGTFGNTGIEELEIKEGVEWVGHEAFIACKHLQKVVIADSVTGLGREAFRGCKVLQEIVLPVSTSYFSRWEAGTGFEHKNDTFEGVCVNKITFTKGTGKTFVPDSYSTNTGYSNCYSIMLHSAETLTTVEFEEGVEEIYKGALSDCSNIQSIKLPESIKTIGERAFYNCSSWKEELHLPENLESLGSEAFGGCSSLTGDVKIPSNLKSIREATFSGCSSLNGKIIFNNIVENIGSNAFNGCSGITGSLVFPESLTGIGLSAFSGCRGIIGKIIFPEKIEKISDNTFSNTGIEELEIKEGVVSVGSGAFENCKNLRKVVIADSVTFLDSRAFQACESLREIALPISTRYSTSETGNSPTFTDVQVNKIIFTRGTGETFRPYYDFNSITQSSKETLTTVEFEEGVEDIYECALKDCNNITSIKLPESIKRIKTQAFYNCSSWKGTLQLSEKLESIGSEAFSGCNGLTDILIKTPQAELSNDCFSDTNGLKLWGMKDSTTEKYANSKNITFKAINYPYMECNVEKIKPGKTYPFTATVYTNINETTKDVIWSVQGSKSEKTTIDESGLFTVADDESAKVLIVSATYGKETASVNLSVNNALIATFIGDISIAIEADEENHIARPFDLEEEGYQYSYYLDKQPILDDEWPLTIDNNVTINVVKEKLYYHITYHLNGGENAADNPESYPVANPYIGLSDPRKEHYEFLGWYLDENFETQITQETVLLGDIDVFAKWQGELYTITFNVNGGNALENSSKDVRYGEELGIFDDATWDNHRFLGWFTSIDGDIQITTTTICEGNLTVYAHWSESSDEHEHSYEYYIVTNPTCTETGMGRYICAECSDSYDEIIEALGHGETEIRNEAVATTEKEGYTGDTYCKVCNTLLEKGTVIERLPEEHTHEYQSTITRQATCLETGVITYSCKCGDVYTEAIAATGHGATEIRNKKDASVTSEGYTGDTYCTICNQKISSGNTIAKITPQTATPGKTIKDKSTNGVYKVLTDGVSVEYTKPVYKKASIRIPDTVKVNGINCKVTAISANAFKNNKSLKSVTIGRNVTVIGTNAFYGCGKLSKVSGGNGIVKIDHRAFANCSSLSKITISGSVRSIGKQAFCNCKKLRSITIKTSTLSGETVGSKAFAGTYKEPTVKVPAKQLNAYKKLLKARGMSSKAVYRK